MLRCTPSDRRPGLPGTFVTRGVEPSGARDDGTAGFASNEGASVFAVRLNMEGTPNAAAPLRCAANAVPAAVVPGPTVVRRLGSSVAAVTGGARGLALENPRALGHTTLEAATGTGFACELLGAGPDADAGAGAPLD